MKKLLKVLFICILSIGIVGCSSEKKELNDKEVEEAINGKYETKNDILTSSNSLLRVQIIFNDGDDKITYSTSTETLTYANAKIKDVDAMITIYNKKDKYDVLNNKDKQDIAVLDDFIATFDENMTTKQFTAWCLEKAKDEVKKHEEQKNSIPDTSTIISQIESKGYHVKQSTAGTTIKDKNQMVVINNGVIGVYDSNYDFISQSGLLYLPQNDAASKQEKKESVFIYQYSTNSFIQGEGSLEEYGRVKEMKVEFDTFVASCGVTQEELATLK